MRGGDRHPRHRGGPWQRMHHAAHRDPEARAAMHAWLREFEARAYYGLDDSRRRWPWQRGRRSLGIQLTLVFVVLAAVAALLARYASDWVWVVLGFEVLTVLAYVAVRRTLRPLWALGLGVAAFGRGDLAHRIPVGRRDEIGALAARFNQMADDINGMLDAKRSLLLAISHELKSPITRARLNAELLGEGPQQQALVQDLGLMRDLIDGLIERERLDAGHEALKLEDADWQGWVTALTQKRFAERPPQVEIEPGLPAQRLDRMRIELLLSNLIANALRHDPVGPIELSVRRDDEGQGVRLSVRDHGPGVPQEALERLGEPFYRPDDSRSRASGGVGLGLSLCKLIAQAHRGDMEIENARPGLRVSVLFPIT